MSVTAVTVGELRAEIQRMTGISTQKQKLMGRSKADLSDDAQALSALDIRKPLLLVGTPEAELMKSSIAEVEAKLRPSNVVDDFDLDFLPTAEDIQHRGENEAKLAESTIRTEVFFINAPRRGKRLLVLDLDHCILHFSRSLPADRVNEMKRPFMDEFLSAVYEHYDIVIWSQTNWRWVEIKLTELGMLTHPNYKICFVLDKDAMFKITIRNPRISSKHPDEFVAVSVKPLQLVWAKLHARYGVSSSIGDNHGLGAVAAASASAGAAVGPWGAHNTVQVDDLQRNFAMNPECGLRCTKFSRKNGHVDRELLGIASYLVAIATRVPDFRQLDHNRWAHFLRALPPTIPQAAGRPALVPTPEAIAAEGTEIVASTAPDAAHAQAEAAESADTGAGASADAATSDDSGPALK